MKHLIRFASIALACGLLVCLAGCSCSSTQQEAQKPVPAETDEGTTIDLDGGWVMYAESNLLVVLDENATTGYSWTSAIEGSTLALYAEKSISAEEAYPTEDANRVGAEGSHLFSFKGMAAGDGTIALSYERSWEQTDDDKKIVLQVKTGQNGAIESVSVG